MTLSFSSAFWFISHWWCAFIKCLPLIPWHHTFSLLYGHLSPSSLLSSARAIMLVCVCLVILPKFLQVTCKLVYECHFPVLLSFPLCPSVLSPFLPHFLPLAYGPSDVCCVPLPFLWVVFQSGFLTTSSISLIMGFYLIYPPPIPVHPFTGSPVLDYSFLFKLRSK